MSASEDRLVAILDGIGECFYALDRDWRITVFNRGAESFFGRSRVDMLGRRVTDVLKVDAVPGLTDRFRSAMDGAASEPMVFPSPARPDRWLRSIVFPLPDGVGASFRDVTEEREVADAGRRREVELARVQRIAGVGGMEVTFTGRSRRSPEYLRLHGLAAEGVEETRRDWLDRVHPEDRERVDRAFRAMLRSRGDTYADEYRIIRPRDGRTRWIAVLAEIERDAAGRVRRLVGAHRDITDLKQAEAQQRLLINELNHRVKNTLATVQSVAAQSLRKAASPEDAWQAFEGRLLALSRAHNVLTRENWEGADLKELIDQATSPYRGIDEGRITIAGDPIRLAPRVALACAMAFQELATNALKYGSLSLPAGKVAVRWTASAEEEPLLRLLWQESGGPPVTVPTRRGFGSRLIERGLADAVAGRVSLAFDPDGLICRLDARLPTDALA